MIRALAFDLDDTLIDTSHLLVPVASREAFDRMTAKGLKLDFEIFEKERRLGALSMSHQKIFRSIAEKHAKENIEAATEAGIQAFYNPPIPAKLPLLPGALENLETLRGKYSLYLVTSGARLTQEKKIQVANISSYFKKLHILDGLNKQRKRIAFESILKTENLQPTQLLSIGNRLSQEIHDAKELGCLTCYFKYGEHVGEKARNDFEIPDFTVETHKDLVQACRL